MQVKLFNTRLDADTLPIDQQSINSFMEKVKVRQTAAQFVNGAPDFWSILVFYENGTEIHAEEKPVAEPVAKEKSIKEKPIKEKAPEPMLMDLNEEEQQILLALKTWRKDKAHDMQEPEFMVFSNATLLALAQAKPRNVQALGQVKGLGEAKIARYGDDLMAILNAF